MTTPGLYYPLSNGVPSKERPRGLHPSLWGAGGSGWAGVGRMIHPTLRPGMPILFHSPAGNEKDGSIGDRPFYQAWADDPNAVWTQRLQDAQSLAAMLAWCRVLTGGAQVWFYIGAPRQNNPDGLILDLIIAGLVDGVCFDALVEKEPATYTKQVETYETHGALIGYEELPLWGRPDFYENPRWVCHGRVHTFQETQAHHANYPIDDRRPVAERAIRGPIMLHDVHDDVTASRAAQAKGQAVFANLFSPPWKAALATAAPEN